MENSVRSIAVLLTCHNRLRTTIRCLDKLFEQIDINYIDVSVYLVDDGSIDGTAEVVGEQFPEVNILYGDGSLYWTGGTRKAMKTAFKEGFDYYVWLNDDTLLYEDALKSLVVSYEKVSSAQNQEIIMGGSMKDPDTGELTYGGFKKTTSWHPLRFIFLEPQSFAHKCDVLNGNFVLFSHEVFKRVGNLHPELVHTEGDFEYCLRAKKRGVQPWIAPGYYGECERNEIIGTWEDTSLSLGTRYKKLFSVKGKPLHERYVYVSNYGGILWPAIYLWVYVKPLLEALTIPFFGSSNLKKNKHE